MGVLDKALRNELERTVQQARQVAEDGATVALERLGVDKPSSPAYLTADEKALRVKFRAHGRQLGDVLEPPTGAQSIRHLVEEVAYQYWHRMLFARFLAENDLLMEPDSQNPVAVSLQECEELAHDLGAKDGWEVAARFAAHMLPQVFRPDSPVFAVALPPERQQELEQLVAGLPAATFRATDAIGWVYQFWQTKSKADINASEVKIGADELAAVTQLFTEPYMVHFLLDNSLGAWWAARRLTPADLRDASTEVELRAKASLPGMPLTYLRFVRSEDGSWAPAAGAFDVWPERLADFKALDPCSGSGHFLVVLMEMLVPMRIALEGLSARDAVDVVLQENLYGLELDQRCVELAAFNVAFAAWTYPGAQGYRPLPELNLACSGLAVGADRGAWVKLAKGDDGLKRALEELYDQFKDAPVLGSLIDPQVSSYRGTLLDVPWNRVAPLLTKALSSERDDAVVEAGVTAQGLSKAASILGQDYTLVTTNPPYLAYGKQDDVLKRYCETHFPISKNDLSTVFLERCLGLCSDGGVTALVLPQNWLFLTTYRKLREHLLTTTRWLLVARLGPKGFQTPMWDYNVQLLALSKGPVPVGKGTTGGTAAGKICGLDVSTLSTPAEKDEELGRAAIRQVVQRRQLENPDARVVLEEMSSCQLLDEYAVVPQGIKTGDDSRFRMFFWELDANRQGWRRYQSTPSGLEDYSGMSCVLRWTDGGTNLARRQGDVAWGKRGVAVSQMSQLPCGYYAGDVQDSNINVVIPRKPEHIGAVSVFVASPEFVDAIRRIDQKLSVTNGTMVKVPFDLEHWANVAREKYPLGLPRGYSNDPTQWVFHGHPCGSVVWDENAKRTANGPLRTDDTVLQVAVARLLGYRWPAELDSSMELADEARAWVTKCDALVPYADKDGIVCVPAVRGESPAADDLLKLLIAAYGPQWNTGTLQELLAAVGYRGKTLEAWLRDGFFGQHCKLFHDRPFIWQVWDGLPDGFSALVNYHKLTYKNLETLTYNYVGDWILRQKADVAGGVDGAGDRLAAAENLQRELAAILKGENPYDIFVRWKPLSQQPVGWQPDLDDGVRLNIRPFMSVPDVKKRGAGVLRDKPRIEWAKDRGKDVASVPWYSEFKGERKNDQHLTLAQKPATRKGT